MNTNDIASVQDLPPANRNIFQKNNSIKPILYQLKRNDIAYVRKEILKLQDSKCPVCFQTNKHFCLDHRHKKKNEKNGGRYHRGLVRGVLCNTCNRMEGKITCFYNRYKLPGRLPMLLRNLATYLEAGAYPFIHPNEKPPISPISKRQYNKLLKRRRQEGLSTPAFPKRKQLNNKLKKLFSKYQISPFIRKHADSTQTEEAPSIQDFSVGEEAIKKSLSNNTSDE